MKKVIVVFSCIFGVIMTLFAGVCIYYFSVTAGVRLDAGKLVETTRNVRVYDADGDEMNLPALKKCAQLSSLKPYVPNAFVAVEDKRFYSHSGFDYRRIGRAFLRNLSSRSFREGASTISQQLIKNTHLTGEKTLKRKLKEMKLTRTLEKKYSKEEILSLYLNSIYFGHGAFGIEDASSFYFGKSAADLSPAESAMLAALVKSPNNYSPFRNPEKCLKRRNFVLKLMRDQNYISAEEYESAVDKPLPLAPNEENDSGKSYLSLVFEEFSALFPAEKPDDSTLKIYTYYRPELQKEIEAFEGETDYSACVADNRTHGIKAYSSTVGRIKRLPASVIKPLLVYAPAIEENILSPATPVLDEKIDYGGYSPRNAGDKYEGYVSARYALSRSINVPAVKILNVLGVDKGAEYMKRMNLPVPEEDKSLALALGGMREGYELCDLAFAYATFANGGNYSPCAAIARIENSAGKTVYEWKPAFTRVFSEDTAALATDILQTAVQEGTAKKLRSLPFQIAAKTGTGANSSGNIDAYTLSYTSEDTVAVWMGMRDNSPVKTTGGNRPAALALALNRVLYKTHSPANFSLPDTVRKVAIDKEEYEKNHRIVLADPAAPSLTTLSELFRASAPPHETSDRFSKPSIQKPTISVKNGSVFIILCQTEYYDYIVKRKNNGKTVTLYEGEYRSAIVDNSVKEGESYEYSVTPVYCGVAGEEILLPSVHIGKSEEIPKEWWRD